MEVNGILNYVSRFRMGLMSWLNERQEFINRQTDLQTLIYEFEGTPYAKTNYKKGWDWRELLLNKLLTDTIEKQCVKAGLSIKTFKKTSLTLLLEAIIKRETIEGIDIAEFIKDPRARFIVKDEAMLSFRCSETLAHIYYECSKSADNQSVQKIAADVQKMGRQKTKENADDFARMMYDKIQKIKTEARISSFRDTVKELNKQEIPTYRGGEWHINTLQNLSKRWKEMGLTPDKLKPK